VSGRLDRQSRQRAAEIGLVKRRHPQSGAAGVGEDAAERKLVLGRQEYQRGARGMPACGDGREGDREFQGRMRGLTCLGCGRQVSPGNEVQPA
jgi:hypothetical protein